MKSYLFVLLAAGIVTNVSASVTLSTAFGTAYDSSGDVIPDGTLWALVIDNGDLSFPGGVGLDAGITASAASTSFSTGQKFSVGTNFGSDRVLAIGGFNGDASASPGGTFDVLSIDEAADPSVIGKTTAFYFFPGVTFASGVSEYSIGTQVGGVTGAPNEASGTEVGMVIPASGAVGFGIGTAGIGGNTPDSRFTAVNLVPEPSSALLSLLGVLGLLRRKRN